jgi:hypothetical protein
VGPVTLNAATVAATYAARASTGSILTCALVDCRASLLCALGAYAHLPDTVTDFSDCPNAPVRSIFDSPNTGNSFSGVEPPAPIVEEVTPAAPVAAAAATPEAAAPAAADTNATATAVDTNATASAADANATTPAAAAPAAA